MLDFETHWLEKLALLIEGKRGSGFRDSIMRSARNQTSVSPDERVISWTAEAVKKLSRELSADELHDVITGCACNYPPARLEHIRDAFAANRDFAEAISMLKEQFRESMSEGMMLEDETIEELFSLGMGPAGILQENRIVATKIPKSGNLRAWLAEEDPLRKRELYCHCPRVMNAVALSMDVPIEYCLCGAGYYRNIWETITEQPVRVEVLQSVLTGDDICRIAIYPEAMKA